MNKSSVVLCCALFLCGWCYSTATAALIFTGNIEPDKILLAKRIWVIAQAAILYPYFKFINKVRITE